MNKISCSIVSCILSISALLFLNACGGGSSGEEATTPVNTAPTVQVPSAPQIESIMAANSALTIYFSAPTSNGGATIDHYTASCTHDGASTTNVGTISPITINGLSNGHSYSCAVTAHNSVGDSVASTSLNGTPTAISSAIDPSKIPTGDGKLTTTTPQVGYLYVCTIPSSPNPPGKAPWISADGTTWDSTAKISVQGAVNWVSSFSTALNASKLNIEGNGLPSHSTGSFPIATTDPAYKYDANPNAIALAAIAWGLPANPVVALTPTCTHGGAIGVLLSGARLYNAADADGRDAVAHEVQDSCGGHPQSKGQYHYHNVSACLNQSDTEGQHSPLVGYIADGFGLYGYRGENGKLLTNADLDSCHGHTHTINVNGSNIEQYHYHATKEFPYSVGCFRGTPVTIQ